MTSVTQHRDRSYQDRPPVHLIRSWQDAEINAATWMRHWGHADAAVTSGGPDGGVDVRSSRALAQVNCLAAAVGRPDLQRLAGAGVGEPDKALFFFSGSDYTATAREYADATGMALFAYSFDGSMEPLSASARRVMQDRTPQLAAVPPPVPAPASVPVPAAVPAQVAAPVGWKARWKAGGWYLGVPILSAGILAAVPFWHAHSRLNRPGLRSLAVLYTVAGIAIMALHGVTPEDDLGNAVGALGGLLETIAVVGALIVMATACIKLSPVRRAIFSRPGWGPPAVDAHLDQVRQARARRAAARTLWDQDPALARELGIGRPDLGRAYDDGGLVDVNSAPASVIGSVCGLDAALAEAIVAARQQQGLFYSVGEVPFHVPVPASVVEQLQERCVV